MANQSGVNRRSWVIAGATVLLVGAALGVAWLRKAGERPVFPLSSRPPSDIASPAAPPDAPQDPAGQAAPVVPEETPAGEPELDRELAGDYRSALEKQGFKVRGLAITDRRAQGGARRADILYRTSTDGKIGSLRPEVVRILGPGANAKLALDTLTVRAARADGRIVATITVNVAEVDRWLRGLMSDEEFYGRWVVRTP